MRELSGRLNCLFEPIYALDSFRELAKAMEKPGVRYLVGPDDTQRAHVIAALVRALKEERLRVEFNERIDENPQEALEEYIRLKRQKKTRPGDGGASRLVPVGDSSPRITNIPHDANVTGDAAFYSTSTTPSSLTVTVMPVLTYSRNSSPSWSTTGIFASVQTSASIAPDAARESIGMLKSMHAG